jgi:hypothetical protein
MMKTTNATPSKWGARIMYGYIGMLIVAIVLGFVAGGMIKNDGALAGDPIAVLSWFILFPAYIVADGILNDGFLGCSLRAALLPLVQGLVIWLVTGWADPFAVSQVVAFIYFLGSLAVVAIARAVRKSRKA